MSTRDRRSLNQGRYEIDPYASTRTPNVADFASLDAFAKARGQRRVARQALHPAVAQSSPGFPQLMKDFCAINGGCPDTQNPRRSGPNRINGIMEVEITFRTGGPAAQRLLSALRSRRPAPVVRPVDLTRHGCHPPHHAPESRARPRFDDHRVERIRNRDMNQEARER